MGHNRHVDAQTGNPFFAKYRIQLAVPQAAQLPTSKKQRENK
jgi:hypothetical protein